MMTEDAYLASLWAGRAVLAAGLAWACVTDWHERRVPNSVCLTLVASGLLWHMTVMHGAGLFDATSAGGLGIAASLAGVATAFAVFFPFYLLKVFGAGDVKLLCGVAAWSGLYDLLPLTLLVLMAGGALAVARLASSASRARMIGNLQVIGLQLVSNGAGPRFDPGRDSADHLPYAWAIAIGTSVFALARYFGWWDWM